MRHYKIAVINLGSTSTKVAYYEDDQCIISSNLKHSAEELLPFTDIFDQIDFRYQRVLEFLESNAIRPEDLDCIASRGGNISPQPGGVYRINQEMLDQSASRKYGLHPSALGLQIAARIAKMGPIPITVDPPTTDEFAPLARYSGLPEISRVSSFQALNQRAAAKKYAASINADYRDLNLIVTHLGGGISIVAHQKGAMVDGNNALDGDGPFSTNRSGGLPVGSLIEMCYSGEFTKEQALRRINGEGGLVAYVGENDVLSIQQRAAAEPECGEVLEAMCYQTAKEIGAMATVLKGKVDAIILTGGIANSQHLTDLIRERVSFIAPVKLYPGEFEMETLASNALAVLRGEVVPKEL